MDSTTKTFFKTFGLSILGIIAVIITVVMFLGLVFTVNGSSDLSTATEDDWNARMITQSVEENGMWSKTALDVTCVDTPKTKQDGTGWYLCSLRLGGELGSNIYPIEATYDSWYYPMQRFPGEVSWGMSAEERMEYVNRLLPSSY